MHYLHFTIHVKQKKLSATFMNGSCIIICCFIALIVRHLCLSREIYINLYQYLSQYMETFPSRIICKDQLYYRLLTNFKCTSLYFLSGERLSHLPPVVKACPYFNMVCTLILKLIYHIHILQSWFHSICLQITCTQHIIIIVTFGVLKHYRVPYTYISFFYLCISLFDNNHEDSTNQNTCSKGDSI